MSRRKAKYIPKTKRTKESLQNQKGEKFAPKTDGQRQYIKAINTNTVIYCTGPAGTGKTSLACAKGSEALLKGEVEKIILTRPTIENAPKGLGALPGDMNAKLAPYVVAVKEELKKWLGPSMMHKFWIEGKIIVEPLEYMQGRTFNNSFMIMDEAQNATYDQIVMFITRVGVDGKVLLNGDIDQTNSKYMQTNKFRTDLELIISKTKSLEQFVQVVMSDDDIVRNDIIKDFLKAIRK